MKFVIRYFVVSIVILLLPGVWVCDADYMYWDTDFDEIALLSIDSQSQVREGSATVTLYTNGDAHISADNTASGPAELSCATDILKTEYKLSFDGDGASATGGANTSYETYDSFLSTESSITYVADDNDVEVTLYVRASNNTDDMADSGAYSAEQTLTVSWDGP
ncbi:hypothetical protein ACFL3G_12845 [Planctomycetota bacterium]